ncbi:MAG: bacteriohopanetetrol glucosamine biosynthesis glycosyltransferase HpnI [Geobacteraceae bacterium]|nr:bacteriohopanetetrol glucosamine biosynthesis glycosyltransferase HpnI [Geobacteraceae bacterium]
MFANLLPFLAILPASIYSLLTLWCGWLFFKDRETVVQRHATAISILKPVKGMDEGSYENFASFCKQDYPAPLQLIFCLAAADDPAIAVIQQLMTDFPLHDISLNIDPTIHGPNYKVSNLINAFPKAKHDLLMICDSDIRVEPTFLQSVTAHFSTPGVGLATSPYRSSSVHGTVTAFEALAFTSEMVPNVVTALKLEGLSFALGAAMTFRRQALQDIGGLEALVDYLADDYQLGNQIHRAGWQLKLDHQFVESMLKPESPATIFSRQLRWARTMRVSRPGGYLASGITLPGLAIVAAFLIGPPLQALSAICLFYLIRLTVTSLFSRRYLRDNLLPGWAWLLPLRDLLAFGTWLLAFTGNRVNWRGHCFLILSNGKLKEL